jgi:ribose transport system substrate-binding protein
MTRRGRRLAWLAVLLALAIGIAACGSSDDSSSTGSAASGSTSTAASGSGSANASCDIASLKADLEKASAQPTFEDPGPPVDAAKAKGKYVVSIPQDSRIPFNQGNEAAMAAVSKAVGLRFKEFKNQGQPSQYVQGMQQAVSGGAAAIDLFATDPRVLQPQIKAAKAKGIKISASQAYDNSQVEEYKGITNADAVTTWPYAQAAKIMADYAIVDSNCKANVHIIHDKGDVIATPAVVETLKSEFASKCPDCKVSESIVSVFDWSTKLQGVAQTALTKDPSINWLIPIYDPMDQFVVPAVVSAGKQGKVKVIACGGVPAALQQIKDGDVVAADVATSATWEGYAVMDNILRVLTGMEPLAKQNYPTRLITDENVDEALPNPDKAFGSDFVAGYKKLWGLGS